MSSRIRLLVPTIALALAAGVAAPAASAQKFQPGSNYICPNKSDSGLDCYLDAVGHLYTMCRHIKSIEVIEFGYENAQQGVNGAKSEYCVDKQKANIARPYQAALSEATTSKDAVNGLQTLQQLWLEAMVGLTWKPGESDDEYKTRVARPYVAFVEWGDAIRTAVATAPKAPPSAAPQGQGADGHGRQAQGARQLNASTHHLLDDAPSGSLDTSSGDRSADGVPDAVPPSADDAALADIFGEGGTLARELPGFHFRPQQLEMAQAVARTIAVRGQLVAEAGTGTGKTFAYLVPALLYGGKVIVSTGTKTLQDQLFERDLPLVRDALRVPVTIALLKGRANYVCHYHLERASREDRLPSRDDARHLKKIIAFSRATQRGDRAELADVPENATIWPLVTSTRDNCLGQNCAYHADCFVLKARRDALEADVVVVNHHLFFADVMLRDEGVSELLPNCNTVILDEAHQLPDTATLFFGEQVGGGQLVELARDAEVDLAHGGARRAAASGRRRANSSRHPAAAPGRRQHSGEIRARRRIGARRLRRRARWPGGGARSPCDGNGPLRRTRRGAGDDRPARGGSRAPGRALARRGERHSGRVPRKAATGSAGST